MSNQLAEQPLQILFEAGEHGIALTQIDQLGATIDEELDTLRERIELAQQGDRGRLQRGAQRPFGGGALVRPRGVDQRAAAAIDFVAVDIEFAARAAEGTARAHPRRANR